MLKNNRMAGAPAPSPGGVTPSTNPSFRMQPPITSPPPEPSGGGNGFTFGGPILPPNEPPPVAGGNGLNMRPPIITPMTSGGSGLASQAPRPAALPPQPRVGLQNLGANRPSLM